jgi:hypothetical protein
VSRGIGTALAFGAALALLLAPVGALAAKPSSKKKSSRKEVAAKSGGAERSSWYAQRLTRGDTGIFIVTLWSKGRRMRAETIVGGVPIVTLVSGEYYYVIDQVHKQGLAVRRSSAALAVDHEHPRARPFGTEGERLRARGAELVRKETIAGRPAKMFQLTDQVGQHRVWITADELALPIRIESTERATGVHVVTDYVDWLSSLELPDDFFEPDPRVHIERIEYEEYLRRAAQGPVGPAPVLFSELLHGPRP